MKKKTGGKPTDPTIAVSPRVHEELKKRKAELGVDKLNHVVEKLLFNKHDGDVPVAGSDSEGEPQPEVKMRRKIKVKDSLYSFEAVTEREGMLEYLTGVNGEQFQMLLKRLPEVKKKSFSFLFFFLLSMALSVWGFVVFPLEFTDG